MGNFDERQWGISVSAVNRGGSLDCTTRYSSSEDVFSFAMRLVKTIPRQFGELSSLTALVHRREMVGQIVPGSEFFVCTPDEWANHWS